MIESMLSMLFLLPIGVFVFAGLFPNKNNNLASMMGITQFAPFFSVAFSIIGAYQVFNYGVLESELIGFNGMGFSIRLDALSMVMFSMISVIAIVVLRFSYNYLDGDANQGKFLAELSLTIGLVQLLVLSGNIFGLFIAWVLTSLALHQLIVYFKDRKKAIVAARKKFIVARLGDVTFLIALILIFREFGTGNLTEIFEALKQTKSVDLSVGVEIAAVLLVLTAGLKSAQIPFHSWLIEVMEAPTPVSALLHAGLLNAGPFLMIRFAYLLDAVSIAPVFLFVLGSLTAIYGALVFTTQPNIKTSLAYSSVAHMGFTMMVCGLGVYSAALLHLVAHSFFKAHSFLSSGSVIDQVRTNGASNYKRKGSVLRIIGGLLFAVVIYLLVANLWGINVDTEYQLLIIGGIIFTSVMNLMVNTLDSSNYTLSMIKIVGGTVLVLMSFFGLEELFRFTLGNQIPQLSEPTDLMKYLSATALGAFFLIVFLHLISPLIKKGSLHQKFGVHLRNGFYINILVDRLTKTINQRG